MRIPIRVVITATCGAIASATLVQAQDITSSSYLYLWTASADTTQPDFLAVVDVRPTSASYGRLVSTIPVPGRNNGPHQADRERATAATPSTVYSVCSISKLFTSIAVMQLRDEGKLRLDDPVARHLPWFAVKQMYPESGPITIESTQIPSYIDTDQARVYRIRGDTLTIGGNRVTWPCRVLLRVKSAAPPRDTR